MTYYATRISIMYIVAYGDTRVKIMYPTIFCEQDGLFWSIRPITCGDSQRFELYLIDY